MVGGDIWSMKLELLPERCHLSCRDLLIFWKDHYLSKDKDCTALEKSSRIKFTEWKATVELLLSEDKTLPTSVGHYIDTPSS